MTSLLLSGATGDLAKRMLLPSLFGLDTDGLLPPGLSVVATARSALDEAGYRAVAGTAREHFSEPGRRDGRQVARCIDRLRYVSLDASDTHGFAALREAVATPADLSIFLSTAPSLFGPMIDGL